MAELAVITPTRGRPARFAELLDAVYSTAAGDVEVWAGVDDDDPSDYLSVIADRSVPLQSYRGARRSLSAWTNYLALEALDSPDPPRYLASLGDDHRPRTVGWDRKLIDAIEQIYIDKPPTFSMQPVPGRPGTVRPVLDKPIWTDPATGSMRWGGPGIAYGNDLLQGERLPTAWVVSADLVRAVGWMMLPTCEHMYVDTAVLELGRAAGCIAYRSDVVVEHLHPAAGKAAWDDSYRASNTSTRYEADRAAFEAWKRDGDGLAADAAKVAALTRART